MVVSAQVIRSPKQVSHEGGAWYPYYAGYTVEFAVDALAELTRGKKGVVLDPWNGSGTTTTVALGAGHSAVGVDANPALVLIARARNLEGSDQSLNPLGLEILQASERLAVSDVQQADPLSQWFRAPSMKVLRKLQAAIDLVLVGDETADGLDRYSDLAAFYYTAAFEAVRSLLSRFRSTNPTWLRLPENGQHRIDPSVETINSSFLTAVSRLATRLTSQSDKIDRGQRRAGAQIQLGDSRVLDLEADSANVCLTSPPYCTRIDYVISSRAELAFMNCDTARMRTLREMCIGAPTIDHDERLAVQNSSVKSLLKKISEHDSRAASSYYAPYFTAYFADLERSLSEVDRVVDSDGGRIGLVVQDSYFKDIHIDLQGLVVKIMEDRGRSMRTRHDFTVGASRVQMNPRARIYEKPKAAKESLLIFN
jgi:SAM-dependent methyltransferase